MLLFEPAGGQMTVNETLLVKNDGKTTWNDPQNGTIALLPPRQRLNGNVDAKATAPDGMPVPRPPTKTSKPDIYKAKFRHQAGRDALRPDLLACLTPPATPTKAKLSPKTTTLT